MTVLKNGFSRTSSVGQSSWISWCWTKPIAIMRDECFSISSTEMGNHFQNRQFSFKLCPLFDYEKQSAYWLVSTTNKFMKLFVRNNLTKSRNSWSLAIFTFSSLPSLVNFGTYGFKLLRVQSLFSSSDGSKSSASKSSDSKPINHQNLHL